MQQEIKTHFKMYKAGKHWLTMGLGMTLLSASFITVTTQKAAAETTDTTAATTTTTTADSSGSYQLSTATTGAEVQNATATAGATSSSIQVAATSQSMTNTNSQTSTTSIITTDSAVSTAAASANQTSATATSSVAASASAAILSQVNSAAGVSTTDTQTSAATAITDNTTSAASTDVHNEVADQFIAGQRSDTNPAAQVPAVGTINSYINAVGQNQIDIPTGLAEDVQTQWLANAKAQATQDYQTTGRQQVITLNDATVDTWMIGDSSRPTVDAVDISSYQGGMTQANFNTLKQLGVKTVIVKLTENTNYTNPYASSQINMARAARLNVEVYHYAKFSTSSAAAAEANYLANVMSSLGLSGNTLVFADMEDTSTYAADVAGNLNQFWRTLSGRGYTNHGVYTYVSYAYRDAVVSTVGASRTWMAQYPYSPSAGNLWNTGYGAWQFSSTACLPGYSGYLDVSVDYSNLLTTKTNENKGNFDHVSIHDNVLHIDGWQAADDAEGKNSSYLILFDKTTNSELGRYQIDRIARPDVAAAYPNPELCICIKLIGQIISFT